MKFTPPRILLPITGFLLLLAGALNLQAANASWTGLTDATWAGTGNWSPTPVPGTGNTATFNGAGNGNTTIDFSGGVTILNLIFDTSSAAAYTIGAGAVGIQTLTLNNGGAITVNSTVANNQLFNAAITLGTDKTAQTYPDGQQWLILDPGRQHYWQQCQRHGGSQGAGRGRFG